MNAPTGDLINGFTNTLTKFSQVNLILDRLENTKAKVLSELSSYGNQVLGLVSDVFDDKDKSIT